MIKLPIMTPLFQKLNFKKHKEILILNHPTSFQTEVDAMSKICAIKSRIDKIQTFDFILVFVTTKSEIETVAPLIHQKLIEDGIVWFAYPKGSSKKYKVEINRDNGWDILKKFDLETVRAVSIDEDWSALRFRRLQFIKILTRKR